MHSNYNYTVTVSECHGTDLRLPVIDSSPAMRLLVLVLMSTILPSSLLATQRELVLVVDQTLCWNCSEPQGIKYSLAWNPFAIKNWGFECLELVLCIIRELA